MLEPESVEVYVSELAVLEDERTAAEVVHATIRHSPKFPPIADILWSYRQMKQRPTGETVKQLEEAKHEPPPPEALAAIRELGHKLGSTEMVRFADDLEAS